jgi:hypothetical protein
VLEAAGLVTTRRRGRQKLHHLNAAPISQIVERWIEQYDVARAAALNALKHALGENQMGPTEFVYVTYINQDHAGGALGRPHRSRLHAALLGRPPRLRLEGRLEGPLAGKRRS